MPKSFSRMAMPSGVRCARSRTRVTIVVVCVWRGSSVAVTGSPPGRRRSRWLLLAQVGADHVGVALHLLGQAGRDGCAEVDDHHPVGEVHHEAHVVLDEDHGHAQLVADVEDEPGHVLGLLDVHPGDGLVEEQELGLHRERAAQLDALLDAVGQQADGALAVGLDLEEVDDLLDGRAVGQLLLERPADERQRAEHPVAHVGVAAEHEVVEHGQVGEQLDVLERARHAQAGDLVRLLADQVVAVEGHAAFLRLVDARQHVEDRGLAGAIGADDREELALADLEADAVDRGDAREPQHDVADVDDRRAVAGVDGRFRGGAGHDSHRLRRL